MAFLCSMNVELNTPKKNSVKTQIILQIIVVNSYS